ncbi:DUF3048 domain-containing protein [Gudongella oleilytica]|uniref:DUF3048 domain-containing protein n=1 Tax=Gudongella oleilytica TaxID=1582259 RepID=UPI002A36AFC3|nr:DUF3048 domain-containing protein [Gudongella oleilytica]MDY0255630.1 DUF3048 domain-containing protein [Gudongella oleilytica]
MKRTSYFAFILILITTSLIACAKAPEPTQEPEPVAEIPVEIPEPEPEPEIVVPEGIQSPLSGIYGPEEVVNGRIMAIVFDNHPAARWQAGLKYAEIVYEYPVEGTFTRYMGLFLLNHPDGQIGPVRSARPYLVTKAYEFDAIFVHVGGSEAAKSDARNLKVAEIDGLTSSPRVFWRESSKKAPNNLYTSMDELRKVQKDKGFRDKSEIEGFIFVGEDVPMTGSPANNVEIIYNKSNNTRFEYNNESEAYLRFKDGKPHVDESDGSQLKADNIIIQKTNIKVLDNEGRLGIAVEGEGSGLYISRGLSQEITWSKKSRSGKTFYFDSSGNEIQLKPGITWIQIIGGNSSVIIE